MRRDSEGRKEMQKAEYRNRKEGMETGRTEAENSTGGTAVRGEREEGKRKGRRLSSQKQAEVDERKRKASRKARKRSGRKKAEKKGSTGVSGCGSETGKDERKRTESRVREPETKARETGPGRTGKTEEA